MGGILKVLIQGLIGGTMLSLPTLIRRLAISLGVGVVVFTGMNLLLGQLKNLAFGSLTGMPSMAANIAGILNIDTAFTIVMSAYAIKITMRSMGGLNPKQIGLF